MDGLDDFVGTQLVRDRDGARGSTTFTVTLLNNVAYSGSNASITIGKP